METPTSTTRRSSLGPALTVLGGSLILVSYFVHWGRVAATRGPGHIDVKGGGVILGAAVVILVIGLAMYAIRGRGGRLGVAIAAVILGGIALLVSLAWALSKDQIRDTVADQQADRVSRSHAPVERAFKDAEESGQIETSTQPGVWLALGGGVLVLIGGIAGIRSAQKEPKAPATTLSATGEGVPAPPLPPAGPPVEPPAAAGPPPTEGEPGTSPEFRP